MPKPPERLTREELYDAIESTRYYPEPPTYPDVREYACRLLGLPIDTDLTDDQISQAAEIAMGHMFTGGEKFK